MPEQNNNVCLDKISVERIALLHPKRRAEAMLIWTEVTKAVTTDFSFCRVDSTLRTFAEQTKLYNQGRINNLPKVTNSPAGSSYHNYGLALDIAFVVNKQGSWDISKDWDKDGISDWMEVVKIFKKYGWEWGGDWKSLKDYPHFEKTDGYNWRKLLDLHNSKKLDKEGYVLI